MGSRGYYERPVGTWILSARYSLERTTSSILVPTGYVLLERECYLRVPYERVQFEPHCIPAGAFFV